MKKVTCSFSPWPKLEYRVICIKKSFLNLSPKKNKLRPDHSFNQLAFDSRHEDQYRKHRPQAMLERCNFLLDEIDLKITDNQSIFCFQKQLKPLVVSKIITKRIDQNRTGCQRSPLETSSNIS